MNGQFYEPQRLRRRQPAQGLVEAAYTAVLLVVVLALILDVALWVSYSGSAAAQWVREKAEMTDS